MARDVKSSPRFDSLFTPKFANRLRRPLGYFCCLFGLVTEISTGESEGPLG
jgi:hypothetical protein